MSVSEQVRLDFQPVIIIGAARSGTNMLRDALTRFAGVATWPCDEINAIWRHGNQAFPSDELPAQAASARVRRYVRTAFRRLALHAGARWVVEKTCANSLRVDFVRAVLPECKFIFLVRDGRDVVASAMKRWRSGFELAYMLRKARFVPLTDLTLYAVQFARLRLAALRSQDRRLASWGPRFNGIDDSVATWSLAEVCAQQWSKCVLQAAESFARISAATSCFVRYETLVANPAAELGRIAAFCGVSTSVEQLSCTSLGITDCSVAKWRTDESARQVARIEPVVEATFQRLDHILPQWADAVGFAA